MMAGRFKYTCATLDGLTLTEKLTVLVEEVGEVAQEVLTNAEHRLCRDTEGTNATLYEELCQVAAVTVAWMESLVDAEGITSGALKRHITRKELKALNDSQS